MRWKFLPSIIAVLLVLFFSGQAQSRPVHYFDCNVCHKAGIGLAVLGGNNVCLQCHKDNPQEMSFADGSEGHAPHGTFSVQDASNAMDAATAAGMGVPPSQQTSHYWASPKDVVPAAGAMAPTSALYRSRYGISKGKVTCTRCHDPHLLSETNPKLLRLENIDSMCLNCHLPWNKVGSDRGLESHPLVTDYPTFAAANPDKYKSVSYNASTLVLGTNAGSGGVRLVYNATADSYNISCTSCHGLHFTDSDSSTVDGRDNAGSLNAGDGKLLHSDGPRPDSDTAADFTYNSAVLRSNLCQTCHTYKIHGKISDGGPVLGCLDCHSGHSYNNGEPSFFVLRKDAYNPLSDGNVSFTGYLDGATHYVYNSIKALDPAETWKMWNDRIDGTANGYCESCHDDIKDLPGSYHTAEANCTGCHSHQGTTGDYSFEANCDGCHTFPPAWGSHQAHLSAGRMLTTLNCSTCHNTSAHLSGTSEVSFDGDDTRTAGATYVDADQTSRYRDVAGDLTYTGTPSYTSCGNLYCHSNATPIGGSNSYANPTWGGAAMSCSSCHDGGGAATTLSARHGKHTDATTYDIDCSSCHADTVSDSATVSNESKHVNQIKDVSFATIAGQSGSYNSATLTCSNTYCHSDGRGGSPNTAAQWSDPGGLDCTGCHNGRISDAPGNQGLQMSSNAHHRLANEYWIRKYPCQYCHAATVDAAGAIINYSNHADGEVDIQFDPKWNIVGKPAASYNSANLVCDNLYCHSDGTTVNPEVRDFPWDSSVPAECDSCHGHQGECSDCHIDDGITGWGPDDEWKKSTPMYANTGPGTDRANSHVRHLQTDFSCANCHANTVVGSCEDCHEDGVGEGGGMTESSHIFAEYHVNKQKDVVFKDGGSYDPVAKKCSNTACHVGDDPVWGDSHNGAVLCLTCHGTTDPDVDDFGGFNGVQARINMTEWVTSGHGRPAAAGNYPSGNATETGNPPADFPGNPCWYCHDNEVLHKDITNPYRLKHHPQFEKRFLKECVYCHMERKDEECRICHDSTGSISHQLVDITGTDDHDGFPYTVDHAPFAGDNTSCLTSECHLPQAASECHTCHENPSDPSGAPQLGDATIREGLAGELYSVATIQVGSVTSPYAVNHIEFMTGGAYQATSCMATPADWPPTGCHTDDVHIHNTGAGVWTGEQKEDVRNQYIMMGVCLQCHDDDDNNRCNSCHTWSGAPEANPYTLGYDPGTGFHTGASNASSTHFGFKHFEAYEHSLSGIFNTATLTSNAKVDSTINVTELKDVSKSWTIDQFVGKAVEITSGVETGKIRPILVNSYNSVTVSGVYNSAPVSGVGFKILDTEWRGGKFCWDCHDPHGDGNIYMIQGEIATKTDGLFGKPLERAAVEFTRTISGLDYARNDAPYNGICNVCHTDVDHYQKDYGDGHRSGRRCTDCHNHGFDEGHGSGQSCTECHAQKPVPNHLGFGQPRDCTKCHDGAVNKRMDIMRQFRGQSHHIQDVDINNKQCFECHWEATSHGLIDNRFHAGFNYKTNASVLDAQSDLVIYGAEKRPTNYVLDSTATIFNAVSIGTGAERENVGKVTLHCLGCHSDQNNDTEVFQDCRTPRQYAWDRTSIAARYSQEGTATLGKYTGLANAAKKIQTKAFSAHGKATLNEGGWSATTGEDSTLPNTRAGSQNVQCYDCHSSHGSYTVGVTSSYRTFDNTFRGANLKETQAGKGGYSVTYKASAVADGAGVVNPMNPGAAQCFDCHETQTAGAKPWGYQSTFGATAPIMGYRDSARFGGGTKGSMSRYAFRASRSDKGGHLKPSEALDNPGGVDGVINGLCSGCHDPHGVSPSLGDNQAYAVPLLKGTWLASPYKEDSPQLNIRTVAEQARNTSSNVNIDRKTFGTSTGASAGPSLTMSENADKFAGLCLRCHPKSSLTDGTNKNTAFKSVDRIHETVKGWGNNAEHNYSCSKCHSPHTSGLGRLMRTDCLDGNHRGGVESGGVPGHYSGSQGYPRLYGTWPACHETMTGAWNNQRWNDVTPW